MRAPLENLPLTATLGAAIVMGASLVGTGCGAGEDATTVVRGSQAPPVSGDSGAPQPASMADASGARQLGRRACAGMTPLEAARHFEAPARRAGVEKKFAGLVADPPASTIDSPGYARLVAAVYAATVPAEQRKGAAAGCVEALAADGEGGEVSSERTGQTAPPSQGGAHQKGSNQR